MPTIAKGNTEIKVACLECIRGHRSSQCAHVNKVLIEVRKPGRPLNMSASLGSLPSHMQPAYVVSGHSRCQCPVNGVIPESDWQETDPTAYPKGKGAEHAFRVGKTGPKIRPPRINSLRKESSSLSDINLSDLTSSPVPADMSSATEQSSVASTPSGKPSCCQPQSTVSTASQGASGVAPKKESNVNKGSRELFATCSPRVTIQRGQRTATAHPSYSNGPQPSDIRPNMLGYYTYGPFKIEYDPVYNDFEDDHFKVFIDSMSPSELRNKFPWKQQIHPPPMTLQQPDLLDGLRGRHASGTSSHVAPHDLGQLSGTTQDGCCCGDDCSCLGCSVHPANARTMDHVREATEFMQNDPHYSDDTAVDFEHVAAILQARQESKEAVRKALSPPHDSLGSSFAGARSQGPEIVSSTTTAPSANAAAPHLVFDDPDSLPSSMLQFSGVITHDQSQSASRQYDDHVSTPPLVVGLSHDPSTSSAGGILPHLRGTSQEPYAMINDFDNFDPGDAYLFSGYGEDQHAYALHPISGNDQVFVMSQNHRPSCVDDHGYCRCGPDCACDGCQVHKTSPVTARTGDYTASGSGESSVSGSGLRGGDELSDLSRANGNAAPGSEWIRMGQAPNVGQNDRNSHLNGHSPHAVLSPMVTAAPASWGMVGGYTKIGSPAL